MKNKLPPLSTLGVLVEDHGLDEVLRILSVISHVQLKDKSAADHIGRARQAIHVKASKKAS